MAFVGGEFAEADVVFDAEMSVQTDRVLLSTDETMMGIAAGDGR